MLRTYGQKPKQASRVVFFSLAICAAICAACGGSIETHAVSGDLGTTTSKTLVVASGVTSLVVRSGALPGKLYLVTTPDNASVRPTVGESGNEVSVQFVNDNHSGPSIATILLNSSVRWDLRLDGGNSDATIDFSRGGLKTVDFASGISSITLDLPKPTGHQIITEEGGASSLHVSVPTSTPVLIRFSGGAGSAMLEGRSYSGIGGGRTFQLSKGNTASDRFSFELSGGVSSFVLMNKK